jgi:hypothetical protein
MDPVRDGRDLSSPKFQQLVLTKSTSRKTLIAFDCFAVLGATPGSYLASHHLSAQPSPTTGGGLHFPPEDIAAAVRAQPGNQR